MTVGLLLASSLLAEITQGTVLQLQEHQDENIQQPSDPTQQTWYQGTSCKSVAQCQASCCAGVVIVERGEKPSQV